MKWYVKSMITDEFLACFSANCQLSDNDQMIGVIVDAR